MDFSHIFQTLADYVEFLINFYSLAPMQKYVPSDSISDEVVAFTIAGLTISYLLKKMGKSSKSKPSKHKIIELSSYDSIPLYFLLTTVYALLLHLCILIISSVIDDFSVKGIFATINAGLAYTAAFVPITQFLTIYVIEQNEGSISNYKHEKAGCTAILIVMLIIIGSAFIYYGHILAEAHALAFNQIIWPMIITTIVAFFGLIGFVLGWQWVFAPKDEEVAG